MQNHRDRQKFRLDGDKDTIDFMPLNNYLSQWAKNDLSKQSIVAIIDAICDAAFQLHQRIGLGYLLGDPGLLVGANSDGDQQKTIDVGSHNLFTKRLFDAGAGALLSEEAENIIMNPNGGDYAVAFDPLDGSGNVGTGAPIGTLFSIFPNSKDYDPFLVKGREQVAAGYISYGHSVDFGFCVGEGLFLGTMDPETGIFYIVRDKVTLADETSDLAYNASVYHHLLAPMHNYLNDIYQGKDGLRGRNFNMRWLGAAVGDAHRILQRGGLFFYVNDKRPGYENGRLRMIYEAFPLAFLCEAAGGKATDCINNILDLVPSSHHGRTPLVFGATKEVDIIKKYHTSHI